MWKPKNWDEIRERKLRGMGYDPRGYPSELFDAGADAMHQADIEFIRNLGDDILFLIQSRLKKEDYAVFFIHSA